MTDQERHRLRAASNQLLILAGMCATMDAARPSKYATQALWRELAVLFGLCGIA